MLNDYSETNVTNSIAGYLAAKAVTAGYLIYWHRLDAVQTPEGLYGNYAATQSTHRATDPFKSRFNNATGLLTLRGKLPANPSFVTQPTSSGDVEGAVQVAVPALAIAVDPSGPLVDHVFELGSKLQERMRHLLVFGFARSPQEQAVLADRLTEWLDAFTSIDIQDHDGGTLVVVGDVLIRRPTVRADIEILGSEATTYGVEVNARLDFVA